jgi:two-component system cell cycle sensor histidine kinase/response regulator CckA
MHNKDILESLPFDDKSDLFNVLNTSLNNAYIKDKKLNYLWVNPAHMQVLGIKEINEVLNKKDQDFFSREYALHTLQKETEVIQEGVSKQDIIEDLFCPDGKRRSYLITCSPIWCSGSVTGLFCTWTDVTVIYEKQNLLLKKEGVFEDLFENATAISALTDENGYLTRINKRASELFFGQKKMPDNVVGKNILDYIHKDDQAKVVRIWKECIAEKKEVNYQVRMNSNDGRIMHLLISGRPIIKDGIVVSFQYLALDMIDQKVQEQNLLHTASVETLGQLAGSFAHDFNNLLTVINGYSEILLNSMDQSHPFYSKIFQICQAGTQASMLTQKILEFSRKHKAESMAIDINEELSNQEALLKHVIEENIRLTIQKSQSPGKVKIDPIQFSKLLINLVINAKDAMPGGGEITISTENLYVDSTNSKNYEDMEYGEYFLLSVRDTGVGMSEDVCSHIFDPFFSTQESNKVIGLWMVRSIVKDTGGGIFVESKSEVGTIFRVIFPISKETQKPVDVEEHTIRTSSIEKKTILVVEDDDTVRDLVREILRQQGHTILTARNGGDALQLARQREENIDLLITDMVMRRIDGKMLANKMQTILPGIKIMLMSGYGEDVIKKENLQDIAFLQKPFLPNELIKKVESLF